jgi:TonB family protein
MKILKPALLLASMLLAMLFSLPRALAGDDISDQLKSEYQGKVLTLRHFYAGKHLVFQADGSLAGRADVGPWTVDGQIFIQTIAMKGRQLQIRGRRVCLVFDTMKEPPRDVLEWLKESTADDRNKREGAFWAKDVDMTIHLDSKNPDEAGLKAAMNAIFLAPGEAMGDIVPDFWRGYFDKEGGGLRKNGYSGVVYSFKKGEVSPPRRISGREPEFAEDARIAKYQGTMVISLVIDPSGTETDLAIVTPLGLGLDEKAVEAVRAWKFEPGIKDGQPVAVKTMVEVDFHLY